MSRYSLSELPFINTVVRRQQTRAAYIALLASVALTAVTGLLSYHLANELSGSVRSPTLVMFLASFIFIALTIFYFRKISPLVGMWYLRQVCAKHGHVTFEPVDRQFRCVRCGAPDVN